MANFAQKSDLPQGTLDLLMLKIIAVQPTHGYAIAQRLQQISRDIVQVPGGSLYTALDHLVVCVIHGLCDSSHYDASVSVSTAPSVFSSRTRSGGIHRRVSALRRGNSIAAAMFPRGWSVNRE